MAMSVFRLLRCRPSVRVSLLFVTILTLAFIFATCFSLLNNTTVPKELSSKVFSIETSPLQLQTLTESAVTISDAANPNEVKKGNTEIGKYFHVEPSSRNTSARVEGCEYPILIPATPDIYCTGALTLYGSIVRNVLSQPEALQKRVCVHIMYIDENLGTIEDMYRWTERANPYTHIPDCAALNGHPAFNDVVPVRFQSVPLIKKPSFMHTQPLWLVALNKIHSWGFDLYPRILTLDADSIILNGLQEIFDSSIDATIVGAPEQYKDCHCDRINSGMVLLKPSRYFHITAVELLYNRHASCLSGTWYESDQELVNCICGYRSDGNGPVLPEFSCGIMPFYNSVWPKNYGCSAVNVAPIRSIHFTPIKPWNLPEQWLGLRPDTEFWRCIRDAARTGVLANLRQCRALELADTRDLPDLSIETKPRE